MAPIYSFSVRKIDQTPATLAEHQRKVMLIVNVASKCGLTPQYDGLERLYEKFQPQGFVICGFPANEFGAQEPGTDQEIQQFCQLRYNVKFPMYSKIVVKGDSKHPLYEYLTREKPKAMTKPGSPFREKLEKAGFSGKGSEIMWNFEKFLVDHKGEIIERFAPDITPEDPLVIEAIQKALSNAKT